jgi:hypothetical protein
MPKSVAANCWRTLHLGRWCVMTARGVTGRCWLMVCDNTVMLSADSLLALIALAIGRVWRRIRHAVMAAQRSTSYS